MAHDAFEGMCLLGLALFEKLLDDPLRYGEVRFILGQSNIRFVGADRGLDAVR